MHRVGPALLVASLGLAATIVANRTVREMERRELEMEFSNLANERCTWVRKAMADHLNDLMSVRSLLDASTRVEPHEFETFVRTILRRQPAIEAIEWVPRVTAEQRASWEDAVRADGEPGFAITELSADGRLVPASADRTEYFPVLHIMPRDANEHALGHDLSSDPIRRDTLERARDTGLPTATRRVALIQAHERSDSFLIILPKYAPNTPLDTRAQRRAALEGFVLGAFRTHDAIEAMLRLFRPLGVQIDLHQVNRGEVDHMATYRPPGPADTAGDDLPDPVDVPFSFAGRDWLVTASATPAFAEGRRSDLPWVTAGSLLLTTLMTCYFLMLTDRAAAVQRLVVQRTAELAGRDADLERTNALLTAMTQAQSQFIASVEKQEVFESVLSATLSVTGSACGFIGEMVRETDGTPALRAITITSDGWPEEMQGLRFLLDRQPVALRDLDPLLGRTLATGRPVIDAAPRPHRDHEEGHGDGEDGPADGPDAGLDNYLGMPLYLGEELIGMVGIANSPAGYGVRQTMFLQPLLATCASILEGYRNADRRRAAEAAQHALNEALSTTNQAIEERNKEIVQLTFAITHDLQTPLATLRGSVNSLAHRLPDLTDDQTQWLDRIKRSAERMVTMLNDLMVYAKAGSSHTLRETVDVASQVALAVDEMKPAAEEKGLALTIAADTAIAIADTRVLSRIVLNLIGNAIKYHDGGREGRVDVRVEPSGGAVRITVADDGPGIDPLRLEEVFQPFKRASIHEQGTGLGLAIVRKSVQAMGGRVWLESDGRSGTTAVIELRPATVAGDGERNHDERAAAA